MNKRIIYLLTLVFVTLLFAFFPRISFAQGNYSCVWNQFQGSCATSSHCDAGYHPGSFCLNLGTDEVNCRANQTVFRECSPDSTPAPPSGGGGSQNISSEILCGDGGINTAIGCIPFGNRAAMLRFFVTWGIGIGGGIAFLMLVIAGFQFMTSSGDPKKIQASKELVSAAIAGIVMLILSVFILRVIGVNILGVLGN